MQSGEDLRFLVKQSPRANRIPLRQTNHGGRRIGFTIVGLFFILGVLVVAFLPETRGKPLPHYV
jgi:hypothetical protein